MRMQSLLAVYLITERETHLVSLEADEDDDGGPQQYHKHQQQQSRYGKAEVFTRETRDIAIIVESLYTETYM